MGFIHDINYWDPIDGGCFFILSVVFGIIGGYAFCLLYKAWKAPEGS